MPAPWITGLGGANFRFEPGFVLEEGHYTPIVFTTDLNTEFDYTKYNDFRFSLTKEQKRRTRWKIEFVSD